MVPLRIHLRHILRRIGLRFPSLRNYGGRFGLARWLTSDHTREQIRLDQDVVIEFDLSVPIFRYIYFQHNLAASPEIFLLKRLLSPQQTFVDVGAHLGYFSLVAAKYARQALAFEPSRQTFSYLQRNLQLNPALQDKIVAKRLALSNQPGELTLYRSQSHPGTAALQPTSADDVVTELVPVDTLDRVLSGEDVDFLKVDVEGGEFNVLTGASDIIRTQQPIVVCELLESFQERFGHSCQEIINFFQAEEYVGLEITEGAQRQALPRWRALNLHCLSTTQANTALFVPRTKLSEIIARLSAQ
jgi:FkbM family methyltransferase